MSPQYLYTGRSGVGLKDAAPLLVMATAFEVRELADECVLILQSNITEDNVLAIFQAAMECEREDLIQPSLQFICR